MPCDGKNSNCERRRELLSQLKCLVSSMDQKKPCEWDEPKSVPPPTCHPVDVSDRESPTYCIPVKACKSYEFRGSMMYRCECIKRNGLQDRCMFLDCMGRPECMTKLYPVCYPGRAALLKLTDLGDTRVALEKYYCADKARESALANYCRLICPDNSNGTTCYPPLFIKPPSSIAPCYGSVHSSSSQLQPQYHNSPIHNQEQKLYNSSTDAQVQQLYQSPIKNCQQPQQYQQQHQQHHQQHHQPSQRCHNQYQQQQPMPYSYSSSQNSPMIYPQQCPPCLIQTFTQC